MSYIQSALGYASTPQTYSPPVEGDDVFPTTYMDDKKLYNTLIIASTWFFDDVLDPEKVRGALTRLFEIGDWRKFGGRYRRSDSGRLEIHVPPKYTDERPAVNYSEEAETVPFGQHPLAKVMPDLAKDRGLFQPEPMGTLGTVTGPHAPRSMDAMTNNDRPILTLHVIQFPDTTVVTLVWPHSLMDAMGMCELVRAWSTVLAGQEDQLRPLKGAREDIFDDLTSPETVKQEDSIQVRAQMGTLGLIRFGINYVWDMIWGEKVVPRTMFLHKDRVERLRQRLLREIRPSVDNRDAQKDTPWISEHDALNAVFVQAYALSHPTQRPVMCMVHIDIRGRISGALSRDEAYIANYATGSVITVPSDVARGPLGTIAAMLRRTLQQYCEPSELLGLLKAHKKKWESRQDFNAIPGPPNARLLITTNCTRAGPFTAPDFAPAVTHQRDPSCQAPQPVGRPTHYQTLPMQNSSSQPILICLGKDHEGNFWQVGNLTKGAWDLVEAYLEQE